jgi:hypothetical protein
VRLACVTACLVASAGPALAPRFGQSSLVDRALVGVHIGIPISSIGNLGGFVGPAMIG